MTERILFVFDNIYTYTVSLLTTFFCTYLYLNISDPNITIRKVKKKDVHASVQNDNVHYYPPLPKFS